MTPNREERRRRKVLVGETFRSANPFWRTWKEAALVSSVMLGAGLLLFILLTLDRNDRFEAAEVAGQLAGGAIGFYGLLIYAPRRRNAWARARNETVEKYGPDKYELTKEKFDSAKVTTIYNAVDWVSLPVFAGLVLLVHGTLGTAPALAVWLLSIVAFFLIRHHFRMKTWRKMEAEVETELARSRLSS